MDSLKMKNFSWYSKSTAICRNIQNVSFLLKIYVILHEKRFLFCSKLVQKTKYPVSLESIII